MKITENELKELVKEAVQLSIAEDYTSGAYSSVDEIEEKYMMAAVEVLRNDLPKGMAKKVARSIIQIIREAVNDAHELGSEPSEPTGHPV